MAVPKVAVIGAGLAGLSCARHLPPSAATVFEKSRVVSGRCATTTWRGSLVDHGAQVFTLSHPRVAALARRLLGPDLRALPPRSVVARTARPPALPFAAHPSEPLHFCESGNRALGDALAAPVRVVRGATVTAVDRAGRVTYTVPTAAGPRLHEENFDLVVCTPPLPQTAALLGEPDVVEYAPCLTALLQYDIARVPPSSPVHEAVARSTPYAFVVDTPHGPLWAACENAKRPRRIAPATAVIVAQSSEQFADRYVDAPPHEWLPILSAQAEEAWHIPSDALLGSFAKRWRYARVRQPAESVCQDVSARVLVCGDGVEGKSDVESAILHGIQTASLAMDMLKAT